ncbi:hypothetical protein PROFUN_03553 [Planoprotostelium fungivorum]|uniref:Protein Abitram n=1 Tax=Planoprotostelium fungivorum TaxID=1890364 RepID=A0A2P6MSE7_9EUKA|nr:hypothetical protein PROFUN_03553 [Planoprotostelium fungivorum]
MDAEDEPVQKAAPLNIQSKNPGKSVIERYYTQLYSINDNRGDQYVYKHLNGLFVIGLASTHEIFSDQSISISKVNFDVGGRSRLDNVVHGKGKKGGIRLKPEEPLCQVTTSDDKVHIIRSCVAGSLLEVNEKLLTDPKLLKEKGDVEGWVAIIQPKFSEKDKIDHLNSLEQYKSARGLE